MSIKDRNPILPLYFKTTYKQHQLEKFQTEKSCQTLDIGLCCYMRKHNVSGNYITDEI